MQKYKRLSNIVIVSLLLLGFWTLIIVLSFLFQKPAKSNKNLLPDEINFVASINTQELINTFLFDIFFKSDLDKKSAQLFKLKDRKEIINFGIDPREEVIFFYDQHNSESAQGLIFNLTNVEDFNRYPLEGENIIKMGNTHLGILIFLNENATDKNIEHYKELAENIINKSSETENILATDEIIQIQYRGDFNTYFQNLNLYIKLENERLMLSGKGKTNISKSNIDSSYTVLKRPSENRFFELQTLELPQEARDLATPILEGLHLEIPKISSQQLIFYGIQVDHIDGSVAFLPQLDWLLRFEEEINLDSLLYKFSNAYSAEIDLENNRINLGSVQYYYAQVDKNEIYLGITKDPYFERKNTPPTHLIRGYPEAILNIEGKGLVAKFITILPQVKFTKRLLEDVTYFDIHSNHQRDSIFIDGEIRLKEDQLMSIELAKYLLRLSN